MRVVSQSIENIWKNNTGPLLHVLAQEFSAIDFANRESKSYLRLGNSIRTVNEDSEGYYNRKIMTILTRSILLSEPADSKDRIYATFSMISSTEKIVDISRGLLERQYPVFLQQLAVHYVHHQKLLHKLYYQQDDILIPKLAALQSQTLQLFINKAKAGLNEAEIIKIITN